MPTNNDWWSEWEKINSILNIESQVCLTHKRFIPCRKDDGTCQLTNNQEDIDHVRRYQSGEVDT